MARTGRTIDPALVVDIDSWLRYYNDKYRNLVYKDGAMLVLDPTNMSGEPVNTIEPVKGDDYVTLLVSSTTPPERRDAAEAARNALDERRRESIKEARTDFLKVEQDLLLAMDAWRAADTGVARTAAANQVGHFTKAMEEADRALRSATYPHRYVTFDEGLPRKILNLDSRDERKVNVYRLVNEATTPKDRTVIAEDTA